MWKLVIVTATRRSFGSSRCFQGRGQVFQKIVTKSKAWSVPLTAAVAFQFMLTQRKESTQASFVQAGFGFDPKQMRARKIRVLLAPRYETGYKAFKASVMKSIQTEEHRPGVEPDIVAKLARAAVSHQQQRDVARRAAELPSRENRSELFRNARAAVPALVRLMLALARASASAAHTD